MTAESLKPFLNPPAALSALPSECSEKKSVNKCVLICSAMVLFLLSISIVGLEIWNISRISELQRNVDKLKQQMQELSHLRIGNLEDFNDFEQAYDTNDIQPSSDEYDEEPYDGESDIEEGSTSVFGIPDYRLDDIETEISVTATNTIDGKRKARSIAEMTYQGIPIYEEPYMNLHQNRSRHQHFRHQQQQQTHRSGHYQQMRQRPEELATPPPQLKLKWDDENREIPSHQQLNFVDKHSTRRHHIAERLQTPFATAATDSLPSVPSYVRRNEFDRREKFVENSQPNWVGPDHTTKPPGSTHDRRSRVMFTNAENKYPKVIKNPGKYMESRQPPVHRVGRIIRKAGAPSRVTALHLAKYHPHYTNFRATNHATWHWLPVDAANHESLNSGIFKLSHNGTLTVNDSGLYFVYAQITYADLHPISGFNILVNGKKHASCSVHGQHGKKTSTCYTAALIDLENGYQLEVVDIDEGRVHLPFQEKTFFGLYKLGRRPLAASNT
ncbi:protein eiger [Toxorhynchites rutilus septentrionalis]|uniref:protein eiger n=1 Tax=Toxorhynchites rutilus septentrionalis TaxID=329112 RepID=UPI00247B14A7|nr:protein eiger [Toxorhynchites rutilus septentrionalis]